MTYIMNTLIQCPGLYCGRELLSDGNWSDCGACMRGFRANASSACVSCDDTPTFYDWLYLSFMALFVLLLHWFFIDFMVIHKGMLVLDMSKKVIAANLSALFEVLLACVIVLQLTEPIGTFSIKLCRTNKLSDWYTLLHNPSPNYEATLHCTQEAVYPLYTMVFLFYIVGVILLLLIRPIIVSRFPPVRGKFNIYAALYFYPILALLHAIGGGLIYYAFPFIIIILSVISSAVHFSMKVDQKIKSLLMSSIYDKQNNMIILGHWMLNVYGIVAIATLREIDIHPWMLILVPLPTVFYILTSHFTDPCEILDDVPI